MDIFQSFLGEIYVKHLHEQYKFDINAITPKILKDAFDLHGLPTHLISGGGEWIPITSTVFLVSNETYTLNEEEEKGKHKVL